MINHPNRNRRTLKLTPSECEALKIAVGFSTAGEWDEVFTQAQYDALLTAWDKITLHANAAQTKA